MDLGTKVKIRRIELGMSQDELALKMGYKSRTSINKIENGRPISQKIIARLASALDTDVRYLMGWDKIEEKPVEVANELADIYFDDDLREMVREYRLLSEEKKKEVRQFVSYTLRLMNAEKIDD